MNKSNEDPTNLNLLQGKHPKTCLENTLNCSISTKYHMLMSGYLWKKNVLFREKYVENISTFLSQEGKKKVFIGIFSRPMNSWFIQMKPGINWVTTTAEKQSVSLNTMWRSCRHFPSCSSLHVNMGWRGIDVWRHVQSQHLKTYYNYNCNPIKMIQIQRSM